MLNVMFLYALQFTNYKILVLYSRILAKFNVTDTSQDILNDARENVFILISARCGVIIL